MISCDDPRLKANKLSSRSMPVGKSVVVKAVKGGTLIIPSQYFGDEKAAFAVLTTEDIVKLLDTGVLAVACVADASDTELPSIGQRIPTTDRKDKIEAGWGDPVRTPEHKVETIDVALFGCEVTAEGLLITKDSLIVINDGAGRLSTLDRQLEQSRMEDSEVAITPQDRGFLWQISFDLSGDRQRAHQNFLLHNRDAKRCSKGTNLCVENSLLDELLKGGKTPTFKSYSEPMAQTYICRQMYENFDVSGSILELFPWNYEGAKSKSEKFRGRGKAASLHTALKDLSFTLDLSGIKPKDLPKKLDFSFRVWHSECPQALLDAHMAASKAKAERYVSKYRLHSTLALKVMILLSIRAMELSGSDEKLFRETCERILNEHFRLYREMGAYMNAKSKKITMDRYWQECKWFCDERFNSGAVNTDQMLKQLKIACDNVCGKREAA